MTKPDALKDQEDDPRHTPSRATNVVWHDLYLNKKTRASLKSQHPCLLWFTGLSGAGKSTIANIVEQKLNAAGKHTYLLDGDNIRHGLNRDLGFSSDERIENIRRVGEVGKLFVDAGLITLASFISPFRSDRMIVRELFEPNEFLEVFVSAPLSVCEQRDPKGLYKKARSGQIPNFTGVDSPYESPEQPELVLDTTEGTPEHCADALIGYILKHGYID
ncbi:MAG: adenylyl-sulfate kinase [Arenicellales bacterium]|jgi:bifunctional enzyme CysN/CysC